MELRTASSPKDEKYYDTKRLRDEFVVEKIFFEDEIKLVYSHIDRIIFGGAMPVSKTLRLEAGAELRAKYFVRAILWPFGISSSAVTSIFPRSPAAREMVSPCATVSSATATLSRG